MTHFAATPLERAHRPLLLSATGRVAAATAVAIVVVGLLIGASARGDAQRSAVTSPALTTSRPSADTSVQFGAPSLSPPSAPTSGLLTRADAIAKAPLPSGDTVTRIEAKLVLRTDLAAAEKGIGGIRPEVDYVWVVARWGQFTPRPFGAPLVRDKQQTPPPKGWRFLLIDARTGEPYVGGGSVAEAAWWTGLPDRSGDPIR
jgi:hypothetical protein